MPCQPAHKAAIIEAFVDLGCDRIAKCQTFDGFRAL